MSEISFNTWIKGCEPISLSDNLLKLKVPNSFTKGILDKRYKSFLIKGLKIVTSKNYEIEFLLESDLETLPTIDETKEKKSPLNINKSLSIINDDSISKILEKLAG